MNSVVETAAAPNTNTNRPLSIAIIIIILLFGGVGSWFYFASLSGAVISSGVVSVKGKPKILQHLDGGIVTDILVSDGDIVKANQVLIRLDGTLLNAKTKIYSNKLREATAQRARLAAERDKTSTIIWDNELLKLFGVDADEHVRSGQSKLFEARNATLFGQISQQKQKIAQFNNQIEGTEAIKRSKNIQLKFFEEELKGIRSLKEKGLASNTKLLSLERQKEALFGQQGEHNAELARLQNSINEVKIQALQAEREFRQSVLTELREVDKEINDVSQQLYATLEQLKRIEIKAPVSGMVHEMSVSTIGGVVAPGGPILQIVPQDDAFEIETNVEPQFIDNLFIGQSAVLRFTAFNQRTTPEIDGVLKTISPNSLINEQTGIPYYKVTIEIPKEQFTLLKGKHLVPGMPVEAFIKTHDRSPLSYLLKPLLDQINHALREG